MRRGFTLIELMVVIGIVVILAGILFPVFAGARNKAYLAQCTTNLRQLQLAVRQYVADNDGFYPVQVFTRHDGVPWRWVNAILPYVGNDTTYACPGGPVYLDAASRPEPRAPLPETSYYFNGYGLGGVHDNAVRNPSGMIALMEGWYLEGEGGPHGRNYPMYYSPWATAQELADWVNELPTERVGAKELAAMRPHNGGMNVAFVDSHVKWVTRAEPGQFRLRNEG